MRSLLPRSDVQSRLRMIFPSPGFDKASSNPAAAAAVAAMLFLDAIAPDEGDLPADVPWLRPSMVMWMSDELYAVEDGPSREAWFVAARNRRTAAEKVEQQLGLSVHRWYADNSREGPRDETFALWMEHGAMRKRPGIKPTSNVGRWAMTESFADLFAVELTDDQLIDAIDAWRDQHMQPGTLARLHTLQQREMAQHEVQVRLPDGKIRVLGPGESSLILKGVVERWAPARLEDPVVLAISEPNAKVLLADAAVLRRLGLTLDQGSLLPDALLVDIGVNPPTFWIIEAVATDGPIDEIRRRKLLAWAAEHRIPEDRCQFLTAFLDRNSGPTKRRLKDLAANTYAWFESEPDRELAWYEMQSYQLNPRTNN